jgi:hypothetical protein
MFTEFELSPLRLRLVLHNQCDRQIGVKKKAGPDRERGASNSNVQAIHGMPLAEKCPWAHIQCGSAFFLQRIELGNPQISDRRGIR